MNLPDSIMMGILVLLGISALGVRGYLRVREAIRKPRPSRRYALTFAGLVFIGCFAVGLVWFLSQPYVSVLIAVLVGSFAFACMDYAAYWIGIRFRDWLVSRQQKGNGEEHGDAPTSTPPS